MSAGETWALYRQAIGDKTMRSTDELVTWSVS